MPADLRTEIKQTKPFRSVAEEASLNIARTAAVLEHATAELLKPYGITPTQYNVLRILRGAGGTGLCRYEVRDRLVAQVPDVTRLLDRMEQAGLIERQRGDTDRRIVRTSITSQGLELLASLDEPVNEFNEDWLGRVGADRLRALIDTLAEVRSR